LGTAKRQGMAAGMPWPSAPPCCPAPAFPAPVFPDAPLAPPPTAAPALLPTPARAASRCNFGGGVFTGTAPISRSTSAGSAHSTPRSVGEELTDAQKEAGRKLPEMNQTIPFVVSNTFINTVPEQDDLKELDGFFVQRQVQSCPVSPVKDHDATSNQGAEQDRGAKEERAVRRVEVGATVAAVAANIEAAAGAAGVELRSSSTRTTLRLAESLQEVLVSAPVLSGSELPSAGSEGHDRGLCKPCAFVHTKGCENGKNCEFCHLCDAGARKRRQKERSLQYRGCHAAFNIGPVQ